MEQFIDNGKQVEFMTGYMSGIITGLKQLGFSDADVTTIFTNHEYAYYFKQNVLESLQKVKDKRAKQCLEFFHTKLEHIKEGITYPPNAMRTKCFKQ